MESKTDSIRRLQRLRSSKDQSAGCKKEDTIEKKIDNYVLVIFFIFFKYKIIIVIFGLIQRAPKRYPLEPKYGIIDIV